MTSAEWLPLAGFVLGIIAGSFIAALVIRWPKGESIARGRSRCDACGEELSAWELVPLLSFVVLRGRCRRCGAAIDRRHAVIELAAGVIGASALFASPDAQGALGAVFGCTLLALAALDLEHFWLPDRLTLPLLALGLGTAAALRPELAMDRLIGAAAGFASLWFVGWSYFRLRGRRGLGGGDPKLLGAIGAWLGWQSLPFVMLLASLIGMGVLLVRHLRGEAVTATTQVPLGTLMAVAAWPIWIVALDPPSFA